MRLVSKIMVATLVVGSLVLIVPDTEAQMARISGKVVDPEGNPIPGVTVTVTTPDSEKFEVVKKTNKKGALTLSFGNIEWRYEIRLEKDGYQTKVEQPRLTAGGTIMAQWILAPNSAAQAEADAEATGGGSGGDKVVRTFNEGVEAQRLGDLDLAEQKYREAAKLRPEMAAPHTALAAVAALRKDWATSAAEAEAAIALDPEDVRAMQIRFDAYRNLGDEAKADEAAATLRKVGNLDAAAKRIFNEGVDAYTAGDVSTAQSKFRQAIELSPELVAAYIALAQISLTQGSPAESLAMAQSALELEPDEIRALRIGFDAARLSGDTTTSGQMLGRLVELDPEWVTTVVYNHAVDLFDDNQLEAAIFELNYVLQADPDMARAQFMLGVALYNSGNVEEGGSHLRKFIELAPDDPDVEIAKGLLSYQQ